MTVEEKGLTEQLLDYTREFSYESLPPEVLDRTKQLFLDFLGVGLGGRVFADASGSILEGVRALSNGQEGPCTVFGERGKFPAHYAALLNGAFAHGMDFDDTHKDAIIHPGSPIFATLMAVAEEIGSSGRDFLAAAVVAYDVCNKLGRAAKGGVHKRGLHPTATTGIFAATAGAARLMGLPREQSLSALGINVSQAAGSQQFLETGGWNKPLHVGLAAHNAIYALTMAKCGFKGAARPLEGRFGYFFSYSEGGWDPSEIRGLGEEFEVMATGIKPYPCCRYNHSVIDAVLDLGREHHLSADDIDSMDFYLSPLGHNLVGEPVDVKRNPTTVVEGQFSAYFASAVAAVDGEYSWQSYRKLQDPAVKALMQATTSHPSQEIPEMASLVTISTRDGRALSKDITLPKGEPENPVTWEEGTAKFNGLAQQTLTDDGARRVLETVLELEQIEDFSRLTGMLRP